MAFDLSSIQKGKRLMAPRVVVYGTQGVGKSTFASKAPSPIFIPTEDGLGTIDTASFPLAKTSADVLAAIRTLTNEDHGYQTAVIDSADWLENILVKEIESSHSAADLAYGKSALILADRWATILDATAVLRNERNMSVIFLAHSEIKRFDSPETEPYDRYQPKLQKRSSELVQEWADAVLFANHDVLVKQDAVGFNKTQARGVSTGKRVLHTQETAAFKAKNRYGLPPKMPLEWQAFENAVAASAA